MGFGMGTSSVSSLVLIQEIVRVGERGSATASNLFSRNLGSTLGATLFGAVLNFGLSHSPGAAVVTSDQLKALLQNQVTSLGDSDLIRQVLVLARAIIDWLIARVDRDAEGARVDVEEVRDIPIG